MKEKIKCPNCGEEIDVEEALSSKFEEHLKEEYQKKLEKQREKIEKEMTEENADRLRQLEEENEKRKNENRELKLKELELLKKTDELKEKEEDMKLNLEKQMLEMKKSVEEQARKKERDSFELEKQGLLKQIEDNKKLAEEMKRKAEQGSMQLQGETQELAIERYLKEQFPHDHIDEIKKGARGGDCIQTVYNELAVECGKIYYESKLTKSFSSEWIDKFRTDMQEKSVDIGVLVTEAMPAGRDRAGLVNGIWICSFAEFKSLSIVLRESLIQISSAIATQENKGDKMSLLYDYLTGQEFRHQIEAIVEGFTSMKNDIEREKRAMTKIWKQRDKQIEKVTLNTINMYGAIKGIGGNAIPTVSTLELAEPDILDEHDDDDDI